MLETQRVVSHMMLSQCNNPPMVGDNPADMEPLANALIADSLMLLPQTLLHHITLLHHYNNTPLVTLPLLPL